MKQRIFVLLLRKYLDGNATAKAKEYVDKWFSAIGKDEPVQALTKEEEDALRDQYHAAIHRRISGHRTINRQYRHVMAVAASLIIVSLIGAFWYTMNRPVTRTADAGSLKSIQNNSAAELSVDLPDGSRVTLLSGAKLDYFRENNTATRTVYLSGTAFFVVTKDPARPFLVHTDKITTRVLGTSFRIESAGDGGAVKVAVVTGSVSVFEGDDLNKPVQQVILTPNQQIVYSEKQRQLAAQLVEAPIIIPEITKKYENVRTVFRDAPANEVFAAMEKLYGIPITYDASQFRNCRITTSFETGEFYNRLSIVCEVLDASYTNEGVSIRLTGKGCPDPNE